ncbi:hypothetical protein MRB53_037583 [Persea americana]|nr:hypothetical protein MRB53_037583 [Persea americana]
MYRTPNRLWGLTFGSCERGPHRDNVQTALHGSSALCARVLRVVPTVPWTMQRMDAWQCIPSRSVNYDVKVSNEPSDDVVLESQAIQSHDERRLCSAIAAVVIKLSHGSIMAKRDEQELGPILEGFS